MIRKRSAIALFSAAIALLTTVPVWLVASEVLPDGGSVLFNPAGGIRQAQWPIYVFLGTFVNVFVVALFAAATLRRTKRTALVLGLIGASFLIVLYGPFWFIGAGLINVYPSQMSYQPSDAPYLLTAGFGGPPVVDAFSILIFMTASMLSVISVVMTLGFAAAALRSETNPTDAGPRRVARHAANTGGVGN